MWRCGYCGQLISYKEPYPQLICPKRDVGLPHSMGITYLDHKMEQSEFRELDQTTGRMKPLDSD